MFTDQVYTLEWKACLSELEGEGKNNRMCTGTEERKRGKVRDMPLIYSPLVFIPFLYTLFSSLLFPSQLSHSPSPNIFSSFSHVLHLNLHENISLFTSPPSHYLLFLQCATFPCHLHVATCGQTCSCSSVIHAHLLKMSSHCHLLSQRFYVSYKC